jgi:hypothetical protein
MAKINYVQLDEDEYFPKAEKFKKKKQSEGMSSVKPKNKIKKQVKRSN